MTDRASVWGPEIAVDGPSGTVGACRYQPGESGYLPRACVLVYRLDASLAEDPVTMSISEARELHAALAAVLEGAPDE